MGFFEKRKFRNFLIFVSEYDRSKPSTYKDGKLDSQYSLNAITFYITH